MLGALLAAPPEGIDTFTALHDRLDRDSIFRYQCGFDIRKPAPSISIFSHVFKAITRKGLAEKPFYVLVCYKGGVILAITIACYQCL